MSVHYPLQYTLEDGLLVEVNRGINETYNFTLTPKEGAVRYFTLVDDERPKDEKTALLDFDELNAVRAFWLKQQHVI